MNLFPPFFRAAPEAHGSSPAREHSSPQPTPRPQQRGIHSSRQRRILLSDTHSGCPLSKARDRTQMLMDTSQVVIHGATAETPDTRLSMPFHTRVFHWFYSLHFPNLLTILSVFPFGPLGTCYHIKTFCVISIHSSHQGITRAMVTSLGTWGAVGVT